MKFFSGVLLKIDSITILLFLLQKLPAAAATAALEVVTKHRVEHFKLRLYQTLENFRIHRRTRSLYEQDSDVEKIPHFNASQTILEPCVTIWCTVITKDETVVFAVLDDRKIAIFQGSDLILLFSLEDALYSLMGFKYGPRLWLIGIHVAVDGKHRLQMYEFKNDNQGLEKGLQVQLPGHTFVALQELKGKVYMSSVSNDEDGSLLQLSVWSGTQFDKVLSMPLNSKSKSIVTWEMDHSLFIAVDLERKVAVFRFVDLNEKLDPVQILEDDCLILRYFYKTGSHYLVCGSQDKALILWWSGLYFVNQQEFSPSRRNDFISDISVIVLAPDYVILVIAQNNRLEYFVHDQEGIIMSTKSYTQMSSPSKVKEITVWRTGNDFYILPVFQTSQAALIIRLDVFFPQSGYAKEDELQSCIKQVVQAMDENAAFISAMSDGIGRVWTRDKTAFLPHVLVNGLVISNRSVKASSVSLVLEDNFSLLTLGNFYKQQKERIPFIRNAIDGSLLQTASQTIKGKINFQAEIRVSGIYLFSLQNKVVINRVNVLALPSALRKSGHQTFSHLTSFQKGNIGKLSARYLNNKEITDYLLLRDPQIVTGTIYFYNLSANDVEAKIVNNLNPSTLVRASTFQFIYDQKQFSNLAADFLKVTDEMKNVNLTALKLFSLKGTAQDRNNYYPNIIARNLNFSFVNGKMIQELLRNSVLKYGDQTIKGLKTFNKLNIADHLLISKYFNHLSTHQLLTLHTRQIISGDVTFVNVSFYDIVTHFVNGVNLHSQVVLWDSPNTIHGRITFLEPLHATEVMMAEKVTLDSVDLSVDGPLLLSGQVYFLGAFQADTVFAYNVKIDGEMFKSTLSRLEKNVWRKKKPQDFQDANFLKLTASVLQTKRLNGLTIDDFLLLDSNDSVYSVKEFKNVFMNSFKLKPGKTLNGLNYDWMLQFKRKPNAIILQDLIVRGNIDADTINHLNIADLMTVVEFQESTGVKRFHTLHQDVLTVQNFAFNTFFGYNFSKFIDSAVMIVPKQRTVVNKQFVELTGIDVVIEGKLNENNFADIVTLDTFQEISSDFTFTKNLKFNIMFLPNFNYLDNIVLTSSENKIANKMFQGNFSVRNMKCGVINAINFESLLNSAASKRRSNSFSTHVTFSSNLELTKFRMPTEKSIDGVVIKSLISTSSEYRGRFREFSNVNANNIVIKGLLNGCNISLLNAAFRQVVDTQAIKDIQNIKITGNLIIQSTVNGMSQQELKELFSQLPVLESFAKYKFLDLSAVHLNVRNSVNGFDIPVLINDAVRQSTANEIIKGKKIFSRLSSVATYMVSLHVKVLNDTNIPLLYEEFMSKSKPQTVFIHMISNVTAGKVKLQGKINNLNLPDDVVLTYTNDILFSPTILNNTMNITSDMYINGLVDGIQLSTFLGNRTTLYRQETLLGSLVFLKNISVQGTFLTNSINNISLKDVVKVHGSQDIKGHKCFDNEPRLESNLEVKGLINDGSLQNLYYELSSIAENTEDFFPEHASFDDIRCQALAVDNINNLSFSMDDMWEKMNSSEENMILHFGNFNNSLAEMNQVMVDLKDVTENTELSSLYGYFELHQSLNFAHCERILPVFESGVFGENYELKSSRVVIWLSKNDSCRSSVMMSVEPDGTLQEMETWPGRVFHLTLRVLKEDVKGFTLHVDRYKRCSDESVSRPDVWKTLYLNGSESQNSMPLPTDNAVLQDIKMIEMKQDVYILASFLLKDEGERLYLYHYNLFEDKWKLQQQFNPWDPSSYDVIFVEDSSGGQIYLAVSGTKNQPGIHVYQWNFGLSKFDLKTSIVKTASDHSLWVSNGQEIFLLLAKEKTRVRKEYGWVDTYTEPTEVMVFRDGDLRLDHTINVFGVYHLERFSVVGEEYVVAVSPHLETIFIIHYRGYNGFQVIQEINSPGVFEATVFRSPDNTLLLAVASESGYTRVLKCIIRKG